MKDLKSFQSVFIHKDPVDMRRGINGLCEIVASENMGDLRGKNLFIFSGRRKKTIKILYFDRSGFCLWQKRLERDKFPWPKKESGEVIHISTEQLSWLLEGFDIFKMKPFEEIIFEKVC